MSLQINVRYLKNLVTSDKRVLFFLLRLINTPILGDAYDKFYFSMLDRKIRRLPLEVTIEPNNLCNLKCVMCPYPTMERAKETMSMDFFRSIVNQAHELGAMDIHLTQYNEPFTDKYLFERLEYIRSKGMRSSFYSNGTLLNDELIEKVLAYPPDLIRFSIDGVTKETYESIRTGGNFEKTVSNVKKLIEARNKRNQKLPVIEVFFTMLDKNKGEGKSFLNKWGEIADAASLYPADSRESESFVGIDYKKYKQYPCFNPKRVIVLSNGHVAKCCVDAEGTVVLGDLKKQTLKEVFESKVFKDIFLEHMERRTKDKMCQNCSKLYIDSAFNGGTISNFIQW